MGLWFTFCVNASASAAEANDTDLNQWLKNQPTVTFITLADHYPYSFIDEEGNVAGIIRDWAHDLEQRFGVNVSLATVYSVDEAKKALLEGRGDVYPFQQFDPGEGFSLTHPYIPYQIAMIVPMDNPIDADLDQRDQRRIAMVKGSIDLKQAGMQLGAIESVNFDTTSEAVRALDKGDIDGILAEPISTMELVRKSGIDDLAVSYLLKYWKRAEVSMMVRSDNIVLLTLMNQQIKTFDVDNKNRILSKWLGSSAYRAPLKGVFGFDNPPYMYPDGSAVGLKHDILQRAFNDMGYQLDDIVTLSPSSAQQAMDNNHSVTFVSGIQFDEQNTHFLSDSILDIEYIPVSLERRKLNLHSQNNLLLGALLVDDIEPIQNSVDALKATLDIGRVDSYGSLESAFTQLRAQNIDLLLVERRVMEWFILNTRFINTTELHLHENYKVTYPIQVDFKTEALRDSFNAALKNLKRSDDGLNQIIDTHIRTDLGPLLKKADIIAQISAYFIVNDRFEALQSVFEVFDIDSSFQVITAQAANSNQLIQSWHFGRLISTDSDQKNLSQLSSITKAATYKTQSRNTIAGSMTFYFDTESLQKSGGYFPSVEQFSFLGEGAKRYISDIYQLNKLTGELLNLNQQERQWIKNNPSVRIGVIPKSLPYESISRNGEYIGMIDDYLTLIERKTGLNIEHEEVSSWGDVRKLVKYHDIQLIASSAENRSLGANVQAANSLFSDRLAVAASRDNSNLDLDDNRGWKVGILANSANMQDIVKRFPYVEWVFLRSTIDGINRLDDQTLDGVIDTVEVLNYLIDSNGYRNLGITDRLDFYLSPTFHVDQSEPLLLSIINQVISSISASEHQKISAKWAAPKAIEKIDHQLVYTISAFSLVIVLLIVFWNRKLAKQITIANDATKALRQAQSQLYTMLNSSPIAACVVVNDKVRYNNDTARRLFDFEDQEQATIDVLGIYESLEVREKIYKELNFAGKVVNAELVLKKFDGTRFVALVSYYRFDLDGELATLFWAFDISQMKQLNQQLEQEKQRADLASQAKSEFLANMSHEIRTPMNAITGLSYLAIGEISNPIARNYIEKVHRSGHSLLSIINDILDFSKIEAGQLFIDSIPFNPMDTFEDVIELMRLKADEKQLLLSMSVAPELNTPMLGDPLRLFQVILNLIGNAIKFTEKGQVALSVELIELGDAHCSMRIAVSDTGIGISEENKSKLFQAFSQADSTTTRRFGGTGLGLNISQKLVGAMGGEITVTSVLGQGSRFSFRLTLPKSTPEALTQFKSQELQLDDQIEFKGQKVLLVEDNELNQDLALAFLTRCKLTTDLAVNGQEALALAKTHRYEMILMDLQMPIMDGFEATRLIREFDKEVPIIAMSANVFGDVKQSAKEAGVSDFLDKPVIIDQAIFLITKYITPEVMTKSHPVTASTKRLSEGDMAASHLARDRANVSPIFSLKRFEQQTYHDVELQNKLVQKFHNQAPQVRDDAFESLSKAEWGTLERNLHTLKSMAASIGGVRLADRMSRLEERAHHRQCDEIELEEGLGELEPLLKELINHFEVPQKKGFSEVCEYKADAISQVQHDTLLSLLESYDNDSAQYVTKLLVLNPNHPTLLDIQRALDEYDFDRASQVLDTLEVDQ
ncbi:transporter substrate-binding domain-containing protein [uncultured Vibrio sp.]|uniref:ATP-binding protein n=1 Tax=uncultured Vibrio sp. TaxID=114054 RepID=UPI002630A106|nr:transporter substrate-binding domain-containing protein [uncultured Vibrio sp.]